MRVGITGATGFIGRNLAAFLVKNKDTVIVLTRNPDKAKMLFGNDVQVIKWSESDKDELLKTLDGCDAIVNLAGENIGSSLWTKHKREKIRESRVHAGILITDLVRQMKSPPEVLIQVSAVGYYGTRGEEILTEESEHGEGFLPEVAVEWEKSTVAVEASGVRYVIVRSGVVLSMKGGAFPKLVLPYRLHVGTILGSGRQWFPWIHYEDEINAIYFLIKNNTSSGIYNLVAPVPARMEEICRQLGPTLMKIPGSVVRLFLGKMGEETMLASQRVVPERLLLDGFNFKFTNIEPSVEDIWQKG